MPAERTPAITDANVERVAKAIAAAHAPDIHHEGAFAQDAKTFLAALAEVESIASSPPEHSPPEPEAAEEPALVPGPEAVEDRIPAAAPENKPFGGLL